MKPQARTAAGIACFVQSPNYAEAVKKHMKGFTLLEMLIAMTILAIIISVGVPSLSGFSANQRLIGAAEQVYSHLQQARSEAVSRNTLVYVNFAVDGTASWEYGMSSVNSLCDLTITTASGVNACRMVVSDGDASLDPGTGAVDAGDLVLMRYTDTDYPGVTMNIASFSTGTSQFVFDPARGTASSGQVNMTGTNGNQLRVSVNLLGRVSLCTPDGNIDRYQDC
jgi:type IV fimbrial biogenesis protein FimT